MKMLRKLLVVFLIAALCVATVAAPVASAAKKVTMTGAANLRSGAGKGYASKLIIAKGETAKYLKKYKKDGRGVYWLKVKYNGTKGWVSTRFARLGKASSKKVTATGKANIRIAPKKSGTVLGIVKKGKTLSYRGKTIKDSRGVKWYHVNYNGQGAWISSRYAKLK